MSLLKVSIVLQGGTMPTKATEGSAAYDVYASEDTLITFGRNKIPLGFSLEFSPEWEALIDARSGFSLKGMEGYMVPDYTFERPRRFDADVIQGKCDSDYRGIYNVIVKSYESKPFVVKKGTRIAQMTFVPVGTAEFIEVDHLSDSDRSEGGFGSTGTK